MPSGSRFKVASKREQNKFIYYVEREQLRRGQDDKVGLKEKGERRKEKGERRLAKLDELTCCGRNNKQPRASPWVEFYTPLGILTGER